MTSRIQVSSPSRRQIFNFKEHFKELLERFQIVSRPSLLELSSASLGKIAVFVNDLEMEDFYEAIPSHCRRHVLLEHIIQHCIVFIPLQQLIPDLVDICVELELKRQAFTLLKGYWDRKKSFQKIDYKWANDKINRIAKKLDWANYLALHFQKSSSVLFLQSIDFDLALDICTIVFDQFNSYVFTVCDENFSPQSTSETYCSVPGIDVCLEFLMRHCLEENHFQNSAKSKYNDESCRCSILSKLTALNFLKKLDKLTPRISLNLLLYIIYSKAYSDKTKLSYLEKADKLLDSVNLAELLDDFKWRSKEIIACAQTNLTLKSKKLALNLFLYAQHEIRQDQEQLLHNRLEELDLVIKSLLIEHKPQNNWVYEAVIDGYVNETPRKMENFKFPFSDEIIEDDDPLTAPLTIERTKRILLEIGRIKNTPANPRKSIIYSSPAPDTIQRSASTYSSLGLPAKSNPTSGRGVSAKYEMILDGALDSNFSPTLHSQKDKVLKRKNTTGDFRLKKESVFIKASSPLVMDNNIILHSSPDISSPFYRTCGMVRTNGSNRIISDVARQTNLTGIGGSSPIIYKSVYVSGVASPTINQKYILESDAMSDIDELIL